MKTRKGFKSFIGSLFIMTNSVSQQRDLFEKYCSCFINISPWFCCHCNIIDSLSSLVVRHLKYLTSVLIAGFENYSSKNALVWWIIWLVGFSGRLLLFVVVTRAIASIVTFSMLIWITTLAIPPGIMAPPFIHIWLDIYIINSD